MKARKVVTRSGMRTRGYFPSLKLGRMVEWESLLERDAILLFEFSNGVVTFQEQPALVTYSDGEEMRRYFPDFKIVGTDDCIIHIEVKPETELKKPIVALKLKNVATHYLHIGMEYKVITEKIIRAEPLLSNLKTLMTLRRKSKEVERVRSSLVKQLVSKPLHFEEVAAKFGKQILLKMIALSEVGCDLNLALDDSSLIYHPEEADHAAVYF